MVLRWAFAGLSGTAMSETRALIRNGPILRYWKEERRGVSRCATGFCGGGAAIAHVRAITVRDAEPVSKDAMPHFIVPSPPKIVARGRMRRMFQD
ncbi:hypothetical protein GCM10023219_28520 [Stakelama sediminis]